MSASMPHPIPYQGSKRRLAEQILAVTGPQKFHTLFEPFAGSAAYTLAAASREIADRYVIGDSLPPLVGIWEQILSGPEAFADAYERVWTEQLTEGGREHFGRVRAEFNQDEDPVKLLYLLARCVKNAPRFGKAGFNQSADHRRKGMRPAKMRREVYEASALLEGRTETFAGDVRDCLRAATRDDLVYMDPPWQGTTEGADKRYHQGFPRTHLEELLADLNARGVRWILSYDGRMGTRTYGEPLDKGLFGEHLELHAGRSSQSTLAGRDEETVESLYISEGLDVVARPVEKSPIDSISTPLPLAPRVGTERAVEEVQEVLF